MTAAHAGWPQTGGRLIYAVGDVHGRDDLLGPMLGAIEADSRGWRDAGGSPPLIVMLGDYIDRGRHSPQVIARLVALRGDARFEARLLLGNHEVAMLDFLAGRTSGRHWVRFGGDATIAAYGIQMPACEDDDAAWSALRAQLAPAIPAAHLTLLCGLELTVVVGDILFVHAGLRPGVPLAQQVREDLLGIRGDFLNAGPFGGPFVVHGHTPVDTCRLWPHRLNVDTGAFMSGRLSAVRLDGGAPVILTATVRGVRVEPVPLLAA